MSGNLDFLFFIPFTVHTQLLHRGFYASCTYFHVEVTSVIYIMGHDKCTSTSETVTIFLECYLQKDVNQSVWGVEATCTKFLYTKDSSFTFQVFVSQVLSCDSTWINAVVLLHFSLPLSISYHNIGSFVSQLRWCSCHSLDVPLFCQKYHTIWCYSSQLVMHVFK